MGGSSVELLAKKDINVIGGRIEAGDRLAAIAGRDIRVESTTRSATSSSAGVNLGTTSLDRVAGLYVTNPGGTLIAAAGQDILLKGAEVRSAGDVGLNAGRDLKLETLTTGSQQDIRWSAKNSRQELSTRETGSIVEGQGDVSLVAGRDLSARAATLSAGDDAKLTLKAERDITLEAGVNQDSAQTTHKAKSGINYYSLDASGRETTLDKTTLSAGRIEIDSGRDTTLSAIEANARSLDIQAGGKLKLETASTVQDQAWHVTYGSSASVGAKGKGQTDETLHYNQLNVGSLSIDARGGIQVQVGQHVPLDQLAKQPGMAWVDQIRNDPKLANSAEWQRVQEAHDKWDYRQSGMGPVSAALVAVMVGAAAAPAASAAAGAAGGAVGGGMAGTVVGGAVKAGVLALSNQVAISFFNNHGDLGKVFDELGSSQSVKNLATAIVTGGVLAGMGLVPTGAPEVAGSSKEFLTLLGENLKTQAASSLIRSAINGTSVGDGLQQALLDAVLNTVAAKAAGGVGDLESDGVLNAVTHKIAHAMAGCALGAAKAGDKGGCAPGAIGAVVGEMMAEAMTEGSAMNAFYSAQDKVYMAGLFGGLAAGVAGGDQAAVNVGNWAGSNAVANNECGHTRMCDSSSVEIKLQGNVAAGKLGQLTEPTSIHLSIQIEDKYSGITVLDGQPGPLLNELGLFCSLCLNSNFSEFPKGNIVWGPYPLTPPLGASNAEYASNLIRSADDYRNGVFRYSIPSFPSGHMGESKYNSNSWASGLLRKANGASPPLDFSPFIAPGYNNPIPSTGFKK